MSRDDDLVGVELTERIFDRLQRIGVADPASSFDTGPALRFRASVRAACFFSPAGVKAGSFPSGGSTICEVCLVPKALAVWSTQNRL